MANCPQCGFTDSLVILQKTMTGHLLRDLNLVGPWDGLIGEKLVVVVCLQCGNVYCENFKDLWPFRKSTAGSATP